MLAIYKKELKSYFHSFIGFLFIGVSLFFIGLYYFVYCLLYGYPYFSYVVNSVVILFMLTVPVLTMRIMAEERRSKTDQLILTAPITVGKIVMGKFLALLTILAVPTAISAVHRHSGVLPDGESGHRGGAGLCGFVFGIYDVLPVQYYFRHGQCAHPYSESV